MTYATWHAWRENRDRNLNEVREEATDAAKRLSTSIDEARRVLHRLSHDSAIIAGDVAACERLTADYQQLHPSFRNIGLVGLDGKLRCSAKPLGGVADFSSYPLFREAMNARSLLLRELPRELSGKSILACVYPVREIGRAHV